MTEVKVTDASGESLTMMDFDGVKISLFGKTPEYIRNVYKNLPNFRFRDDDVFIASYPKAVTYGNYFSYASQWEDVINRSALPIHVVYYEDLKTDTLNEIRRLAKFLDLSLDDKFLEEVAENCQFDVMKKKYTKDTFNVISFKDEHNFYRKVTYGNYFSYASQWEDVINRSALPIHVVYYEDLKTKSLVKPLDLLSEEIWDKSLFMVPGHKPKMAAIFVQGLTSPSTLFRSFWRRFTNCVGLLPDIEMKWHLNPCRPMKPTGFMNTQQLTWTDKDPLRGLPVQCGRYKLCAETSPSLDWRGGKCNRMDTLNEIRRLAKFLDLSLDDKFLEEVAENCQFDVMKKKYTKDTFNVISFKDEHNFYRKGVVGDWKNWYTVSQNDLVKELTRTSMANYETSIHFGAKYEL